MVGVSLYKSLVVLIAVLGAILETGAAITALAHTFGRDYQVSVALAIVGVIQLLALNISHAVFTTKAQAVSVPVA